MKNRYIGDYPVIGIRPTIDGRRGPLKVRESLEDQTMAMAQAAKKLFEDNIQYSNGDPVKVVIADTTIGRVAEAAACAAKFKKEGVDITLTVTQLIANVNAAFGTSISAQEFSQMLSGVRATYIDVSDYTGSDTKNNLDLVQWAIDAQRQGWGYVWGSALCSLTICVEIRNKTRQFS